MKTSYPKLIKSAAYPTLRRATTLVLVILGMALFAGLTAAADAPELPGLRSPVQPWKRAAALVIDQEGDTVPLFYLNPVTVYPPLKFKNKKEEKFYWRTVRDVKRTLPYAKLIAETLVETYEYIETFETQKEREDYLKSMESALFKQYKPILKKFSKNQARTLVKLIQRETNQSSYEIVKAFLGSFRAAFWQGFGKLFGVSLKSNYNPDKNHDDSVIERVAVNVEMGLL